MSDWQKLGLTVRATSQGIDERLAVPLLADGPSKLSWDLTLIEGAGDVEF